MLLALIIVCMSIASRLDPIVLGTCAFIYLALLPVLRRVFEKEPFLMDILPRALRYRATYPRQSREVRSLWKDRVR